METFMSGVVNHGLGFVHDHFEVAAILEFSAYPLRIFVKFCRVVSTGEKIFQEYRVGHADRTQIFHCRAQDSILDVLVAFEPDLANFDLWTFFDHKGKSQGSWRNGMNL